MSLLCERSGRSGVVDKFGQLEDYVNGSPLGRKTFETEDGSSEKAYIASVTMERFCLGAHPSLLWPVYMMHRQVRDGPVCLSACVYVCVPLCLCACLPVCLSASLSACLSICLSVATIPLMSVCVCLYYYQLQKFFFGCKFWDKIRRSDLYDFLQERGVLTDAFACCEVMSKLYANHANTHRQDGSQEHSPPPPSNYAQNPTAYDLFVARKVRGAVVRGRRGRKVPRQVCKEDEARDREVRSRSPMRDMHISEEHRVKFSPDNSPVNSPQTSPTTSPLSSPHSSPPSSDDEADVGITTASNHYHFNNFIDPYTGKMKYLRILVIEDSQFQRKLIVHRLRRCLGEQLTNYEDKWPVVSVQSGEEALTAIEQETVTPYNVFIVDENLDGGGGVLRGHEVISSLRRNPHIGYVIIIGCTANIAKHGQILLDAGANAVWSKPIPDPIVLQQNITELLLSQGVQKTT